MNDWFSIRAAARPTEPVQILIYDQIGRDWFSNDGVSAKEFAQELNKLDPKQEIEVVINSPGGNVWDGFAIYNQLRARRQFVSARVDGIAASIASIIALAGRSLVMPENSLLMIHDPSGLCMGDAADMRDMAENLDKHADLLAGIYAGKSGKSREKMRDLMAQETWLTAAEALELGLADETAQAVAMAACANFDFSKFVRIPDALKQRTANHEPRTAPVAPGSLSVVRCSLPTPSPTMNKTAILALLKQNDKALTESATDEQILAALSELVSAGKVTQADADKLKKPDPKVIVPQSDLDQLRADFRKEKELRLRSEIRALAVERPWLEAEMEKWLKRAMDDESILNDLRAMPVYRDDLATDPIRPGRVRNEGNALIEKYRDMQAGEERLKFAIQNWHQLERAHEEHRIIQVSSLPVGEQLRRLHQPRAANTYGASLVTDRLADQFITTIGTKLAALRGFSRDFGVDRLKPRATVQVPKATAGSSTQTNPTNFESGDSTTTNVAVSVAQISQDFHVTNDELNKGHTLMRVAAKNSQSFANALSDVYTALITTANYGAATIIGAAANFDALDLAPIYALAKNYGQKNLILDGGHLAFLLPTDKFKFRLGEEGAYNFDLIAEQNRWTGATANTVGFICDPNAIAVASGLPADLPASEFIELGTVQVEMLGLTALIAHWFSRAGRVHWMSYDIMFGAAAGDTTAAELLVTA